MDDPIKTRHHHPMMTIDRNENETEHAAKHLSASIMVVLKETRMMMNMLKAVVASTTQRSIIHESPVWGWFAHLSCNCHNGERILFGKKSEQRSPKKIGPPVSRVPCPSDSRFPVLPAHSRRIRIRDSPETYQYPAPTGYKKDGPHPTQP
jgi:hypothetical protein